MPTNVVRKFDSLSNLQSFLNGAIIGRSLSDGFSGLNGKTITFSSPAASVTFGPSGGADPNTYSFKNVRDQIVAAIPALDVLFVNRRIVFIEVTPTSGVALGAGGGGETARPLLGFDNTARTGRIYSPPNATTAPRWLSVTPEPSGAQYIIMTWE